VLLLPPADDETRADLAVKRETVTPFWWALKTLLKVGWGHSAFTEPGRHGSTGQQRRWSWRCTLCCAAACPPPLTTTAPLMYC
jgi:hypothetical protein